MRLLACTVTDRPGKVLRSCIEQVLATCPDANFLVVNNGRNPKEFTSELPVSKDITFAHVPVNLGHPVGVNCGMQIAASQGYDFFLLVDDNVELVTKDWYSKCLELMKFDKKIGLIGAKVLDTAQKTVQWGYTRFNSRGPTFSQGQPREKEELGGIYRASMVAGCFLFMRLDCIRKVGFYDLLFSPARHGDADYAFRVWLAGYSCVYDGRIEIVHYGYQGYTPEQAPLRKLHMKGHRHVLDLKYDGFVKFGLGLEEKIEDLGREIALPEAGKRRKSE